jgi:23S rRNA pseudouridine1911/1915/1917 synthase
VVPPEASGQRADVFVAETFGLSRAGVKKLFEAGEVRIDGKVAAKGARVSPGQTVSVAARPALPALVPEPGAPLTLLRETQALLFLDKPSGVPAHPLEPGETGTLANALVARFPQVAEASEDPREGGLCHRLDIETSGVMVAAKTRAAWSSVRAAFGERSVDKRYWALVRGPVPDEGEIDLPLRHGRRADRVEPAVGGGDGAREALSELRVLARHREAALVEVRIHTGVLHQVRAHLAAIGAPIVGDALYGGPADPGLRRFFLHARRLSLRDPDGGEALTVESPLPPELAEALARAGIRP